MMSDSDSSRSESLIGTVSSEDTDDESLTSDSADVSKTFGHVKVSVVKDEIGKQQADVIINTTSTELKLDVGGVSKGLLKVAGNELQNECNTKYPNGITYGNIAETGGAKLQCKTVYHICLKTWNGEQTRQELKQIVNKCLKQASDAGHTSIAFPALGTGLNKYPKETVAKTIFSCVEEFQKNNSGTSLVDVRCVIFPADTASFDAFQSRCGRRPSSTIDTSEREINVITIRKVAVHLTVGNIAEKNCDVIVTTSTRGIKLKGGRLSHYVLDVAGPNLQTEVDQKYPQGIQHGEIAVLSPGGLPCKFLYCGALPRHDRPPEGSEMPETLFRKLILACLNQAMKDGAQSISFPSIGTGYLKYPPEVSAKNMLQAITEFAGNNPNSAVIIYIVLHKKEDSLRKNLKVFERVCQEHKVDKPKPAPKKATNTQLLVIPPPRRTTQLRKKVQVVSPPKPAVTTEGASGGLDEIGGASANPEDIPERNTPEFCMHMYSSDIRPPSYWTKYTSDKTIKQWKTAQVGKNTDVLVDVDPSVFNMIEKLVQRTWEVARVGHGRDAQGLGQLGYNKLKVTKVQRIENLTLYDNYKHGQQHMFHQAGEGTMFTPLSKIPGVKIGEPATFQKMESSMKDTLYTEVNEGYFFHGARKDKLDAKIKEGLDPRLACAQAVFGQAVYMSESSTKADQYTDDRNQREKTGLTMLLVRCSMGEICLLTDTKKLARPPCKVDSCRSDTCTHEDRYNSVVEEGKYIFREFCVYDKQQVYPEYVITYDRVKA